MEKLKHLFFDGTLKTGQSVALPKHLARRLSKVLRARTGHTLALFNGKDGLFSAEVSSDDCSQVDILRQIKPFIPSPEAILFIALSKRDAMDHALRQGTELGITRFQPVLTEYCVSTKINLERVAALLVEASEQCERLDIPLLSPAQPLQEALSVHKGHVYWCAEHLGGKWGENTPVAGDGLLVGPEGGFSDKERDWLKAQSHITPVGLGRNILRVDTAVVAACSQFLEHLKD